MLKKYVLPAILTNSEKEAAQQLASIQGYASWVHIDIMDNTFVHNTTLPVSAFKKYADDYNLEAHIMTDNPEKKIHEAASHGFKRAIFHLEAVENLEPVIQTAKNNNIDVGIAINPETPIDSALPFLKDVAVVLVMGVNPGKSGQKFDIQVLQKIEPLKLYIQKYEIETAVGVDGGINLENVEAIAHHGVDHIVSHSGIFDNGQYNPQTSIEIIKSVLLPS